jgi:transposase-like protein
MPKPLNAEVRAAVEAAIRAGGKRNEVARAHGVSPSTVTKIATEAGLTGAFDRSQTKRATEAQSVDLAAQRVRLSIASLDLAEHTLKRARAPYTHYVATKDDVVPVTLPEPPLNEVRQAATAFGILADKSASLERHDADTQEARREVVARVGAQMYAVLAQVLNGLGLSPEQRSAVPRLVEAAMASLVGSERTLEGSVVEGEAA